MVTDTPISSLVSEAFDAAGVRYRAISATWIKVSSRVGGLIPNSLLMPNLQNVGRLDLLLRCMEDEQARALSSGQAGFEGHYHRLLAELWIGNLYEIFRLLRQRKLGDQAPEFAAILSDLELLRMPLEKLELAKDGKLKAPLTMVRNPRNNDSSDTFIYDPKDDRRAHIMSVQIRTRDGSIEWHGLDVVKGNNRWINRRDLSDRVLGHWN